MWFLLLVLIALGVWLFCLFDVLSTDEAELRHLPRSGWLLVVLLGFWIGAIGWLLLGRPRRAAAAGGDGPGTGGRAVPPPQRPEAPRGPDDDPDFLNDLDRRLRGDE